MDKSINELKESVDNLLSSSTEIKVKKRSKEDKEREDFIKIINQLQELQVRNYVLFEEFNLPISDFEKAYYEIIETLIEKHYGKAGKELIMFYLYDSFNEDGSKKELYTKENVKIPLENSADLWVLINNLNKK